MSEYGWLKLEDVPTHCPECNTEVICAKRTFANGSKHIGALCQKVDCHPKYKEIGRRRYVSFSKEKSHQWITPEALEWIQRQGSDFGAEFVLVGPEGDVPPCSYKGCKTPEVEMHHIMPIGYADDADDWPLVALCQYHHHKWHAMLTTGLMRNAIYYNRNEIWRLHDTGELVDEFTVEGQDSLSKSEALGLAIDASPWIDMKEAEDVVRFARINLKFAEKWLKEATNECLLQIGEEPVAP